MKIQQKKLGGGGVGTRGGGGVRVDVNEELKFFGIFPKKIGGGGGQEGRGGGQGGCECNVGYGGCEPRIEGILQCTKRYCTILRK